MSNSLPHEITATPEQTAELEWACRDVREWLDIKMRTGQYSIGLVVELARHFIGRGYNVHSIYGEIGTLEGDDRRTSVTKAAAPFRRPPLLGLWHKHHNQACFIPKNLRLEPMKDGTSEEVFAPYYGRFVGEVAGQIAYDLVMKPFDHRTSEHRMTGEFIVYERQENGTNYYLTLGSHGEYDEIRLRVEAYKQIDREIGPSFLKLQGIEAQSQVRHVSDSASVRSVEPES